MPRSSSRGPYKVLCGICPDDQCQQKLFFPAYDVSIECSKCGQRHEQTALKSIEEVTNPEEALHNILRNLLVSATKPKQGTDSVKVLGLSNYQCKLISPFLTKYGMDKASGKAKLLTDMKQQEVFDCGVLGSRNFLIEPEHIDTVGYGRDRTGSMKYLKQTLETIRVVSDEETLLPIHADGDGHCLVHAVSRALVGRELFWHALRTNLKKHFETERDTYKSLFQDFIDVKEWEDIIDECDSNFEPRDGEGLGLRNIHVFGLANILRRPIVLLDSTSGLQSSGDYTGIFLPALVQVEKCKDKDGKLNPPICLAWSSKGHNHYIALVAVKGRPLPRLPSWMIPKVWGLPQDVFHKYIDLDEKGGCALSGDKCLQDRYILRLVNAMEEVFQKTYKVSTSLVADVHHHVYKTTGMVGFKPEVVLEQTQKAVSEGRLYRCLTCDAISELTVVSEWLRPGGSLYKSATSEHGRLRTDKRYEFPMQGLMCTYDEEKDELVANMEKSRLKFCAWCQGSQMRVVCGDGSIKYMNGDRTTTRSTASKCRCGFKHFWNGKEYDNLPYMLPVQLEWKGNQVSEKIAWFQFESDTSLNSNVYREAQAVVQKHFPGEFGSEVLVQRVVSTILMQTQPLAGQEAGAKYYTATDEDDQTDSSWRSDEASKIILTGAKKTTFHKEELTMNETEKAIKKRVETNAPKMQRRLSDDRPTKDKTKVLSSPSKVSPKHHSIATEQSGKSEVTEKGDGKASSPAAEAYPDDVAKIPVTTSATISTPSPTASSVTSLGLPTRIPHRITTSDGRQRLLYIEKGMTYQALSEFIQKVFSVPCDSFTMEIGPPSTPLTPPALGEPDNGIPIRHNGYIHVTISDTYAQAPPVQEQKARLLEGHISGLPESGAATKENLVEHILQGLAHLSDGSSGDTEHALMRTASAISSDLWPQVQNRPEMFTPGGLYYEQMKNDLGLKHEKHCTFPNLPGKTFAYNEIHDRLELCLQNHGHVPVGQGQYQEATAGHSPGKHKPLRVGGSGAVSTDPTASRIPFSGKGYTLSASSTTKSEQPTTEHPLPRYSSAEEDGYSTGLGNQTVVTDSERISTTAVMDLGQGLTKSPDYTVMTTDEAVKERLEASAMETDQTVKKDSATGAMDTDQGVKSESVGGEMDTDHGAGVMDIDQGVKKPPEETEPGRSLFKRVGPGYTVLNQDLTNQLNLSSEKLHQLASSLLPEEAIPMSDQLESTSEKLHQHSSNLLSEQHSLKESDEMADEGAAADCNSVSLFLEELDDREEIAIEETKPTSAEPMDSP